MPAAKPSAPVAASGTPAGGQRSPVGAAPAAGTPAGGTRPPAARPSAPPAAVPTASPPAVAAASPGRTPGPQAPQAAAPAGGPSFQTTQPMVSPDPAHAQATQPMASPGPVAAAALAAGVNPHATQPLVPPGAHFAPPDGDPEPSEPTFVLPDDQLAAALGMLRGGGPIPPVAAPAPPVAAPPPPAMAAAPVAPAMASVLGPEPATVVPVGGEPQTLPPSGSGARAGPPGAEEHTTTRVPVHPVDVDPDQTRPEGALPSLAVPPEEGQNTSPAVALPSLATEDSTGEIRDAAEVARRLAALGERLDPPPPPRPLVPLGSESGPFMLPATSSERKRDMHLASDSQPLGFVRDVSREDTRTLDIPMPNLAAGQLQPTTDREVTALDRPRPAGDVPAPGTLPEVPAPKAGGKPRLSMGLILLVLVLAALAGAFTAWRLAKARGQGRLERPGATLLATPEGAEPRWRGTAKLGN